MHQRSPASVPLLFRLAAVRCRLELSSRLAICNAASFVFREKHMEFTEVQPPKQCSH